MDAQLARSGSLCMAGAAILSALLYINIAETQKNANKLRPGSQFAGQAVSILRHMDTPLSQTANTLKLEEIRRRCEELSNQPMEVLELSLEDSEAKLDGSDPYNTTFV